MEENKEDGDRSEKRKVTLCSDVIIGNEGITFNRRTFWYKNHTCLHEEVSLELQEKLRDIDEPMVIEMPLEDPASYLN